ncbi:MAG TPA: hypothetical protein VGB85_33400 [Nannocystis sp.]
MARSSYVIDDEPVPDAGLTRYIVNPLYPLLAVMLAGVWLAWPWMLLNARALGSPHWRRQAQLLAVGLAGTVALALVIVALVNADVITTRTHARLALLAVTTWKMAVSYKVHSLQLGTFALYSHYHGDPTAQFGVRLLMLGMFLRGIIDGLIPSILWIIIVSGAPWTGEL